MRHLLLSGIVAGCVALVAGCAMIADVAQMTGVVTPQQAQSMKTVGDKVSKAKEKLTPENEYYIGRAVVATLLKDYKPYDKPELNQYLNVMGRMLAAASAKPETFAGYHFLAVDSDEINAFAAPGGFIVVSRGLLRCCKTEDALAAVLAHEVGHVENNHALNAIGNSRWVDVGKTTVLEAGKSLAGDQVAAATAAFGDCVGDVVSSAFKNGYGKGLEYEADASAVRIMAAMGYNPTGLKVMLQEMDKTMKPGGLGFMKTHPEPKDRIKKIESAVRNSGPVVSIKERQVRFDKAMAGI